ncbi:MULTISPECIES: hypothetical protein [Bacillus]|uniref:hypothetical protein n=1 Tax=Bacillus TaxID=1386 RepID=UPI000BB8C224|nr:MULTISPECIES: hypothetical protein [Bacillus]
MLVWVFLLNVKQQTLKNFHQHVNSILYVCASNFLYYLLCKDYILWDFKSNIMSSKAIRTIHLLFIMPLVLLLYLENYPKQKLDQLLYISKWVVSSAIIECVGQRVFKMIYFDNGWHIGWSLWIYVKMFIFSIMFKKYPFSVLATSFGITVYLLKRFKVPVLSNMKEYWSETKRLVQLEKHAIVTYLLSFVTTVFCILSIYYYFRKNKTLRFR